MVIETPETWAEYKIRVARFWDAALVFWRGRRAWVAWSLCAALLVLVLAQLRRRVPLQLLERPLLRRAGEARRRGTGVQGRAARATGRHLGGAVGHRRGGAHDHPAQMARGDDALHRRSVAVRQPLPTHRPRQFGLGEPRIPHRRGCPPRHRRPGRPCHRAGVLGADRAHLLWRVVERRRLAHRHGVRHRLDHSRLSGVCGGDLFHLLHLDDVPDRPWPAQGDPAEEPGGSPLPRCRGPAARPAQGSVGGDLFGAPRHLARGDRRAAPLARTRFPARPHHGGAAVQRAAGAGGGVAVVRAEISRRHHEPRRADPGRGGVRHRAERVQLGGRQL